MEALIRFYCDEIGKIWRKLLYLKIQEEKESQEKLKISNKREIY
jgi:hypothetical protein